MNSRQYSSFLLRFWLTDSAETTTGEGGQHPMVLQIQHLQTGAVWRLNSLQELNELLGKALLETPDSISKSALHAPKKSGEHSE